MLKLYDYLDEVLSTQRVDQLNEPWLEYSTYDVFKRLGYQHIEAVSEPITRAVHACVSLSLSVKDNFKKTFVYVDGQLLPDWRLSSLACYLVMMNCDPLNPLVAKAQMLFMMKPR